MMNNGVRILLVLCLATFPWGCADGNRRQAPAEAAVAKELTGTWDIALQLERSPLLVADPASAKDRVKGSLAFLANDSPANHYPGVDALTDYGTYDIDFSPFGFDPRNAGRVPTVVVGWIAGDSVEIVFSPDQSTISVGMRGRITGDTVSGNWEVTLPRAGGGGGSFLMTSRKARTF